MKTVSLALLVAFIAFNAEAQNVEKVTDPVEWVNTLMGTDSRYDFSNGNTLPFVGYPWGMNLWTPQTAENGYGWQYTYSENKIRGFKQSHEPSPWINDFGVFSLMPETGKAVFRQDKRESWFSHKSETAKPYYYSVYLSDYDLTTEITTTERAASFRFTFPKTDSAFIIVDAFKTASSIQIIPSQNKIIGYSTQNSGGLAKGFKNWFVIVFDKPFDLSYVWSDTTAFSNLQEITDKHVGAVVHFKTLRGEQVNAKVASSFISQEQAEINLQEIGQDNFETVEHKAKDEWNKVLGHVIVEGGTVAQVQTFYSCLFRMVHFPQKLYEKDAKGNIIHYSPYTGKIEKGYLYGGTGFWDTFRALYPFLNLVYPSISKEMQEGLINDYNEGGWLPEWSSPGYRQSMIGNNSASIVADAYLKGIHVSDINKLYEALIHGSNNEGPIDAIGRKGVKYYNELGYIPYDVNIHESAARTLEYAYDDFTIYQLGKALNRPKEELDIYAKRSYNYRFLFDSTHNLMRGKNSDGSFQSPFNPFKWGDAFTEGNSWHYTWCVFHDIQGLINLMGGKKTFVGMLDSVFVLPPVYDDSYYHIKIHEITEMQVANMGQYAHGNQPIQHAIYLYNYAGEPWKAQYWARQVMNRMYKATPDGFCGDEDNGQTSAWYVFSALGFYPVCPATDQYILGAPLFKKITLNLENGKHFVLSAPNNSATNFYVQSSLLNGKAWDKNWINHNDILKGGNFTTIMGDSPNKKKGVEADDVPYSFSTGH